MEKELIDRLDKLIDLLEKNGEGLNTFPNSSQDPCEHCSNNSSRPRICHCTLPHMYGKEKIIYG